MSKNMFAYGKQTIKNIWFDGLKAVVDYFSECVKLREKVQIVIEYDPLVENTVITYYRATEKQDPKAEIQMHPTAEDALAESQRRIQPLLATKEQLRAQLRETLFTYAQGLSVSAALGQLRRLGDELTQIALQTTDASAAISNFSIDVHGNVQAENTAITYDRPTQSSAQNIEGKVIMFANEDNDKLILTTVGGKEAITLPKKEAIALGKIIMDQSQSLKEQ